MGETAKLLAERAACGPCALWLHRGRRVHVGGTWEGRGRAWEGVGGAHLGPTALLTRLY